MVDKFQDFNNMISPSMQYSACYKQVHQMPFSMTASPPEGASAALPSNAGLGLMAAANGQRFGTVIPNRIFVGGIDFKTNEEDLQKFFSAFGTVRDTKIIRDRAEVSKGYGFVTFNSSEEVNKVRDQEDCLYLNGKKLNIGQAVRKPQPYFPKDLHVPGPLCSWVIHPGGYASYTNSNGITYFLPAPQLLSPQVALQNQHPYVMAYNGSCAATVNNLGHPVTHYAQGNGAMHPIQANLALPWNPTQPGSCGQLLTSVPTIEQNQPMNVSMIPIASANSLSPANIAPTSRTPNPQCNKGSPMLAAAIPQTHIQIPTSYVCSPLPAGHQSVPLRFASHSVPPMFHTFTESSQPLAHSVNFSRQGQVIPTDNSGEMTAVALPDGNIMSAYGLQPTTAAIYPTHGQLGMPDINMPMQYAPIPSHQPSEVLTPPPTPEIQAQTK